MNTPTSVDEYRPSLLDRMSPASAWSRGTTGSPKKIFFPVAAAADGNQMTVSPTKNTFFPAAEGNHYGKDEDPSSSIDPLSWAVSDVKSWLHREKFNEEQIKTAIDQEIDGKVLFYISEKDLEKYNVFSTLGARKRFLVARQKLATEFNVSPPLQMEMADKNLDWQMIPQIKNSEQTIPQDQQRAPQLNIKGEQEELPERGTFQKRGTNLPDWQKKGFDKARNVAAGLTICIEMTLNMLDRVHPACHLISLCPGFVSIMCGSLSKRRLWPNSGLFGGRCKGNSAEEHAKLVKEAREKNDWRIAYEQLESVSASDSVRKQAFQFEYLTIVGCILTLGVAYGVLYEVDALDQESLDPPIVVVMVLFTLFLVFLGVIAPLQTIRRGTSNLPLYGTNGTHHCLDNKHEGSNFVTNLPVGSAGIYPA